MTRTLADARRWTATGTVLCANVIHALPDDRFARPSALPDWSLAHLVAHLDGNARALCNLVTWAHTGVETPMYSSMDQRNRDIESGARLAPDDLRRRFTDSAAELAQGMDGLSPSQWETVVRTAQGRDVSADEVPWLRAREVMVHAVDLGGDITVDDLPADFLVALVDDVVARRRAMADHPAIVLVAGDREWRIDGVGEPVTVTASLPAVAAYATGRSPDASLPAWL
jgi:maleylpyruvate isomerase